MDEIAKAKALANAGLTAALGVSSNQPRGLHNFIQELRESSNKEEEQKRVDKELANIRAKFAGNSGLSSYNKKKYVWKLVYMFMLGYEIDFGHMEMISLISSAKYSEKNVGYIAVSLLLRSGDEMMTLVINSMRNDLISHSNPAQTLALATIANLGGPDLAEALTPDVQKLLIAQNTESNVRKKAALCLLKFFRENPDNIVHNEWADRIAALLEEKHLGVVTSVMSLLLGFTTKSPADYEGLVPYIILLLTRLVIHRACVHSYLYYTTPCPWLQVKLLKFLQFYPPPSDQVQRDKLNECIQKILTKTEISDSVNKCNADHCILFEAVNLIIQQGADSDEGLRTQAMSLLGRFIAVKEPNIRYLGLETMSRLARLEGNSGIKKHRDIVIVSLKDADISIRRRALDLLFVMADAENAVDIVEELLNYLAASDAAIREEMVLKVAILAEKFRSSLNWYVDKMLQMISLAGDFVSSDVWHRIIQIVTNNKDLQAYAAEKLFRVLEAKRVHETAVNVGGYILGEFGYFIAEQEGMSGCDQFRTLHQHFANATPGTKALLLSTYVKLSNLYPECRELVNPVFDKFSVSTNLELQQRSCEYMRLPNVGMDVMEEVLKEMPAFSEDRESAPEARLRKKLQEQNEGADGAATSRSPPRSPHGGTGNLSPADASPERSGVAVVDDLLDVGDGDLLNGGMGGGGGATAHAPSQAGSSYQNGLGVFGDEPVAEDGGEPQGVPQDVAPQLAGWLNALTVAPQGILYQDHLMRIGVQHEYRGSQGRLAIFYMNLGASEMHDFKVTVPQIPYLRYQVQEVGNGILPGSQAKHQIMCECTQPFSEPVEFRVEFALEGRRYCYQLHLPVVASCFMEPVALPPQDFMQRWQLLVGDQREQQAVVQSSRPIDSARMAEIRQRVVQGMKMGIVEGIDTTEFTISAAGTFRTGSTDANGNKILVGAMTRVEANPQAGAFRVTTRAVHWKVAEALTSILKVHVA